MVKVMSVEFKEKFEDVSKNTQQIEMKVTNEEEMEDVIFLVSLQAKKLRNALVWKLNVRVFCNKFQNQLAFQVDML